MGKITPSFRNFLIMNIIGNENFKVVRPQTRGILILDAIKQLNQELIQKYGTMHNYHKQWCKKNGFESVNKYKIYLAKEAGFNSRWERNIYNFKKKYPNMKNWQEFLDTRAKEEGFNSHCEKAYLRKLKRLGFESKKDYLEFKLAIQEKNKLKIKKIHEKIIKSRKDKGDINLFNKRLYEAENKNYTIGRIKGSVTYSKEEMEFLKIRFDNKTPYKEILKTFSEKFDRHYSKNSRALYNFALRLKWINPQKRIKKKIALK